ncbi:MAG TPA: hypothetical protein VMA36_05225 [Candidatus Limnocylindria bacterium]|nr:hypothetical protein [Candidatus Limnocylindria bacterium]
MLGTTFVFVVVLALLAGVVLDGAAAFARAGIHAAADHVVDGAADDAVAAYQRQLASAIASDRADQLLESGGTFTGTPAPVAMLSSPSAPPIATEPTPPPDPAAAPRFVVRYSVTPTTVAPPHCAPTDASSGHDTIGWLQCDGFVQESRMSLRVAVQVFDPAGSELIVQREENVALRLFAEPPYSAVTGRSESGADDPIGAYPTGAPHEGDVGGDTRSGGVQPPPAPSPYPSGGTLIHVQYACQPGTASCAQAAPPDPDLHLRANAGWTDGNVSTP